MLIALELFNDWARPKTYRASVARGDWCGRYMMALGSRTLFLVMSLAVLLWTCGCSSGALTRDRAAVLLAEVALSYSETRDLPPGPYFLQEGEGCRSEYAQFGEDFSRYQIFRGLNKARIKQLELAEGERLLTLSVKRSEPLELKDVPPTCAEELAFAVAYNRDPMNKTGQQVIAQWRLSLTKTAKDAGLPTSEDFHLFNPVGTPAVTGLLTEDDTTMIAEFYWIFPPSEFGLRLGKRPMRTTNAGRAVFRLFDDGWRLDRVLEEPQNPEVITG